MPDINDQPKRPPDPLGPDPNSLETQNAPITGALQAPSSPDQINLQSPPPPRPPTTSEKVAHFIGGGQATPGSVWRGILSGALTGMVAGAGQGHFGTGMAAGGAAQQKQAQQKFENKITMSREEQERQVRAAQIAKTNHDLVSSTWDLSNRQATAAQEHAQFENNLEKEVQLADGSRDLGVVRNPDDLVALHKEHPELPQDLARGNIFTAPHFTPVLDDKGNPTGEQRYDGTRAFYIPPEYGNQKIDHDITVPLFIPGKTATEAGHYGQQTLKAGTVTNSQALQLLSTRSAEAAKYDNEAALAKAEALKAKVESEKLNQLTPEEIDQMGHFLAADPVHLDLKTLASLRGGQRTKVFLAAKKYNPNFNPMQASIALKTFDAFTGDGKIAQNLSAFNPAIRHLALLGDAAAAFKGNDLVALNRMARELGAQTGDERTAIYNAIHAAVTGEVGKVYKGASPTDDEIKIMEGAFNQAQSPEQAEAAVRTTVRLMGEKVQDYYRTFANGTGGQTPEQNGIQMVNPDVQDIFKRYGLTGINRNAPPVPIKNTPQIPTGGIAMKDKKGNTVGYRMPDTPPGQMIPLTQ